MPTFYVLRKGQPFAVEGEISGEYASVPLPLGGERRFKWPQWYASRNAAMEALEARRLAKIEKARKVLAEAGEK